MTEIGAAVAGKLGWTAGLGALALVAGLVVPGLAENPPPSEAEADIELKTIHQQLEQAREKQDAIAGELSALRQEAAVISRRLAETAARIQSREAMVTSGEDHLRRLEAEEHDIMTDLTRRREALAELLAGLQRLETNPPPPLVTRPDDALSALRGAMLFGAIVPAIKAETTALANQLARLENVRAQRLNEQRELEQHLDRLAVARADLADLHQRKLALLSTTRGRLEAERERANELAKRAETLRQLLDGLAEERRLEEEQQRSAAEEEERRRKAERNRPRIAFTEMRGRLDFPAQGQRIRRFGEADGFGGHSKGLYVATRKQAQVTAPADGEIEFAGEFRSYGQLLILNVGESYHVLLAGLGTITAEPGQMVRAGEPVGAMGEIPARGTLIGDRLDDPRPILYIEFRKDGSAIDPSVWWVGSQKEARG